MQAEKKINSYQTMIGHGPHVLCPTCESQIHFVTTTAGKKMPCQLQLEYGDGKKTLVTNSGRTVVKAAQNMLGYQPHWGFCKR